MKQLPVIIIFLWATFCLSAQSPYKLSVTELFERGIQNSLTIKSAREKVQISEDKKNIALKNRLPDIGLNGSVGYVGKSTILDTDLSFLTHPKSPSWKQNYQITVSQPLYEGGLIQKNITKAELEKQLAELSMQNDQSSLKLWLIGKYLDLFNLYKESEVYRHNIVEAKSRLLNIERMKDEGMVTNNDVLRSQLAVSNYELAYDETQNNILLVSQQLDIVLGMNENRILQPDMNLFDTKIDVNAESDYLNQSYTQYPLLKMAKTNIDIAQNNLDLAKSTYLPKLSLQAGNTFARPIPYVVPSEDLYINSWGLTLSLSFNISSYFSKKDNLNQAKRQINLSQLALEQQKQAVRTELKSAYIKHREALDRIKILEKSLEQSTENYRIVKNKYFNRLSILTDLLDANAILLESELQLTQARTNAIYTYYQLQEISGNL